MEWVNIVVQGVLIGGLYAMFAAGLALIFGVMRLVNIAHGDLIVLAAYIALITSDTLELNPLLAIIVVVPIMAAIGYGLQRALLNRTLGDDVLPPLLVTFGLSVIIQNALLELFTADSRRLRAGSIEVASFQLTEGVWIGVLPLLQFVVAVAVIGALQLLFYRTAFGRAFRATRTISRWRSSWASITGMSLRSPWRCRSRLSQSPACSLPCALISIRRSGPRG